MNEMFGHLDEAVFIDTSSQMHSLAKRILMKGKTESKNLPGGRFFRHQMSKDHKLKYDLVTCAFTLSEIPGLVTNSNLFLLAFYNQGSVKKCDVSQTHNQDLGLLFSTMS